MGGNTSSLTDTFKLRIRLRTWTRGQGVALWLVMLIFPHFTPELSLELMDSIDPGLELQEGSGPFAIFENMMLCIPCMVCIILCIRVLREDTSDSDHSALASKTAIFDLADCSSAWATCTAASLRTGPLGGLWLGLGETGLSRAACLCSYSASISSIVGVIVPSTCAASIISLNTATRLAGWGTAMDWIGDVTMLPMGDTAAILWTVDWAGDVTTLARGDIAATLGTGYTLWSCTGLAWGLTIFSVIFLGGIPSNYSPGRAFSCSFALAGSLTTRDRLFFEGEETFLLPMALHLLPFGPAIWRISSSPLSSFCLLPLFVTLKLQVGF